MVTSFGLCRPSSGQNIYRNLNAAVYNVLFVNVMGSHLQSIVLCRSMPAVVLLSAVSLTQILYLTQYCAGDKIEKNEMGWACGAYE